MDRTLYAAVQPIHFSLLKHIAKSPAHYQQAVRFGVERKRTFSVGSAAHRISLGQGAHIVYPGKVRRGKEWEAFELDNPNREIVSRSEYDAAFRIADALDKHPTARDLLKTGRIEETLNWTINDRTCEGTPDVFTASRLVELKTTRDSSPFRFARDAQRYCYHAQLAWYLDGLIASGQAHPTEAFIVAVESSAPYPVTVFELTEHAIELGRRMCRLWFERLMVCEQSDSWPAYSQSVETLDFDDGEVDLVIGGEPMRVGQHGRTIESDEEDDAPF